MAATPEQIQAFKDKEARLQQALGGLKYATTNSPTSDEYGNWDNYQSNIDWQGSLGNDYQNHELYKALYGDNGQHTDTWLTRQINPEDQAWLDKLNRQVDRGDEGYGTAVDYGDSDWADALRAAGLDPTQYGKMTQDSYDTDGQLVPGSMQYDQRALADLNTAFRNRGNTWDTQLKYAEADPIIGKGRARYGQDYSVNPDGTVGDLGKGNFARGEALGGEYAQLAKMALPAIAAMTGIPTWALNLGAGAIQGNLNPMSLVSAGLGAAGGLGGLSDMFGGGVDPTAALGELGINTDLGIANSVLDQGGFLGDFGDMSGTSDMLGDAASFSDADLGALEGADMADFGGDFFEPGTDWTESLDAGDFQGLGDSGDIAASDGVTSDGNQWQDQSGVDPNAGYNEYTDYQDPNAAGGGNLEEDFVVDDKGQVVDNAGNTVATGKYDLTNVEGLNNTIGTDMNAGATNLQKDVIGDQGKGGLSANNVAKLAGQFGPQMLRMLGIGAAAGAAAGAFSGNKTNMTDTNNPATQVAGTLGAPGAANSASASPVQLTQPTMPPPPPGQAMPQQTVGQDPYANLQKGASGFDINKVGTQGGPQTYQVAGGNQGPYQGPSAAFNNALVQSKYAGLGRQSDIGGSNYWNQQLNSGNLNANNFGGTFDAAAQAAGEGVGNTPPGKAEGGMIGLMEDLVMNRLTENKAMGGLAGFSGGGMPDQRHPHGQVMFMSEGGERNYVQGPGTGQSDDVPAMLANGEYVIDSDVVAALGDGSNEAGAQVLDQWRQQIRAHKRGGGLADIPPKSLGPDAYLNMAMGGSSGYI